MKKKIVSLLVTMGLAASLVPVSVFADGTDCISWRKYEIGSVWRKVSGYIL